MPCGKEFRYPHSWETLERSGLVVPREARVMLEERDRDLEDFISNWPCPEPATGGGGDTGYSAKIYAEHITSPAKTGFAYPNYTFQWETNGTGVVAVVFDTTYGMEMIEITVEGYWRADISAIMTATANTHVETRIDSISGGGGHWMGVNMDGYTAPNEKARFYGFDAGYVGAGSRWRMGGSAPFSPSLFSAEAEVVLTYLGPFTG